MNLSKTVAQIIETVKKRGDRALCDYALRFDGVSLTPSELRVSQKEIAEARKRVSPHFVKALKQCAEQVQAFAVAEKKEITQSWMIHRGSVRLGQLVRPVDSVGLYIPGGRFPYPSTVLMTGIPARAAGVKRVAMVTPPKNLTPEVLVAASIAGIDEVYRVGGAGAIAALAIGTSRIKPVDFIAGPGNQFVTEAKRQVYGTVGIDSLAGPSEVVIVADTSVPARFIQSDLLAQAEHDPNSRSTLLTADASVINEVRDGLDSRIRDRVFFEKFANLDQAIERANALAPEHLELLIRRPERYLAKVRHAGAVFLGAASPAAMGDYVAGPSHVLPTRNAARFSSGLSVATFLKRSSVIGFKGVASEWNHWSAALQMAETEGMEHHASSLRLRLQPSARGSK